MPCIVENESVLRARLLGDFTEGSFDVGSRGVGVKDYALLDSFEDAAAAPFDSVSESLRVRATII